MEFPTAPVTVPSALRKSPATEDPQYLRGWQSWRKPLTGTASLLPTVNAAYRFSERAGNQDLSKTGRTGGKEKQYLKKRKERCRTENSAALFLYVSKWLGKGKKAA